MTLSLLTGFPGFIGRRLVRHLLESDPDARIAALVEPRMLDAAREVAAGLGSERVEVLPGDITDRRLALRDEDYDRLARDVRLVFHLAAIYDLAVPLEAARRVNVAGTANVLEFCRAAEGLQRLSYVSTAYVAGKRTGTVQEHELAAGQDFKNHYESTKYEAEMLVREAMDRIPATVVRPAIVVGDSRTGETEKFDGPYFILRVISRARRLHIPIVQFGRAEAAFNAVPVDFIVKGLAAAASDPRARGETLHLVDPEPLSSHELFEVLAHEYAGRSPHGRIPPALGAAALRVKPLRGLLGGTPPQSLVYLNHPVVFDTARAVDLLTPHGLRPPNFREYVGPMVEFFKAHEDDERFVPGYTP
jgi:thioester reductase-like protein